MLVRLCSGFCVSLITSKCFCCASDLLSSFWVECQRNCWSVVYGLHCSLTLCHSIRDKHVSIKRKIWIISILQSKWDLITVSAFGRKGRIQFRVFKEKKDIDKRMSGWHGNIGTRRWHVDNDQIDGRDYSNCERSNVVKRFPWDQRWYLPGKSKVSNECRTFFWLGNNISKPHQTEKHVETLPPANTFQWHES